MDFIAVSSYNHAVEASHRSIEVEAFLNYYYTLSIIHQPIELILLEEKRNPKSSASLLSSIRHCTYIPYLL